MNDSDRPVNKDPDTPADTPANTPIFLENCLFFNVNAFSRQMLKLAEASFGPLKLSPAHASLLLVVYDRPGIGPKDLAGLLQLTPSTITRFVDALVKKKLLCRRSKGKTAAIHPTERGLEMKPDVAGAYKAFYLAYTRILGTGPAHTLALSISRANTRLGENTD